MCKTEKASWEKKLFIDSVNAAKIKKQAFMQKFRFENLEKESHEYTSIAYSWLNEFDSFGYNCRLLKE